MSLHSSTSNAAQVTPFISLHKHQLSSFLLNCYKSIPRQKVQFAAQAFPAKCCTSMLSLPSSTSITAQATPFVSLHKHRVSYFLLKCCKSINPTHCCIQHGGFLLPLLSLHEHCSYFHQNCCTGIALLFAEQATVYNLPSSIRPQYIRHQQHPFWLLQKHRASFFTSTDEQAWALPLADRHQSFFIIQSTLSIKHPCCFLSTAVPYADYSVRERFEIWCLQFLHD